MKVHTGKTGQRDTNEEEIVDALRKVGATVQRLSIRGVPDLLVGFRGRNYLLEVKVDDPNVGLTDDQARWFLAWRGGEIPIVRTIDQAMTAIGVTLSRAVFG